MPLSFNNKERGDILKDIEKKVEQKRIGINIVPLCACTVNVPANCDHVCS